MWGQTRSFSVHPQTSGNFQTAGSRGLLAFFLLWRSFAQSQHEGAWPLSLMMFCGQGLYSSRARCIISPKKMPSNPKC